MDRFKARSEAEERWIAETADALACAERLAARLVELRGSDDIAAVLSVQAEIALLRRRVEALEVGFSGQEVESRWAAESAWGTSISR